MIVHERRIAEIAFQVTVVPSVPMIAHRMSVIAVMNVRLSALVIIATLVRRPCHARHDEGTNKKKKGYDPEHELGNSAACLNEQRLMKLAIMCRIA